MDESYYGDFQYEDDGSPWDEYKWELFMREQDEKAVKYFDKFSKSKDLPNCEELIARELSWDYGDEEDIEEEVCPHGDIRCEDCPDKAECEEYVGGDNPELIEKIEDETFADFRRDPIWKEAYDLAIRLQHLAKTKMDLSSGRGPLFELLLNSRMVPAKIAGAFGIGFHVDAIGGNIANHKRALSNTINCLGALTVLEKSSVLPQRFCTKYRRGLFDMRECLMRRIDELRLLFHKLREEG